MACQLLPAGMCAKTQGLNSKALLGVCCKVSILALFHPASEPQQVKQTVAESPFDAAFQVLDVGR